MPNEILTQAEIDIAIKQLEGWRFESMQANLR